MRTVGNTKIQIFSFESTYGPKDEKANILVKYYLRQILRNESEHNFFSATEYTRTKLKFCGHVQK